MIYLYLIILLFLVEIFLRNISDLNDENNNNNIKRIPNISLKRNYEVSTNTEDNKNSIEDKELGWELRSDSKVSVKVKLPYIRDDLNYSYEINNLGARTKEFTGKKKILGFFGCSITYGHGLREEQTFPYIICKNKKEYGYLNFGVAGYSLYQSLLRYIRKKDKIKFDKIIVTIHEDLERRNTCSFSWVKLINRFWGVPSVIKIFGTVLKLKPRKYFIFSKFNLRIFLFFEFLFNYLIFFIGDLKFIKKNTNEYLLKEFKNECKKNDTELIILCLDNIKNLKDYLNKNQFNWCFSEIDLNEIDRNLENKWLLMPWDNHPNEKANNIFANKIGEVLDSDLRPFRPKRNLLDKESKPQDYIYPIY